MVDAVVEAGTSEESKRTNPVAITATRLSLLGQDAEAYAKACTALAEATQEFPLGDFKVDTFIITGSEDKVSTPQLCNSFAKRLGSGKSVEVLDGVGHWHVFENLPKVAKTVQDLL